MIRPPASRSAGSIEKPHDFRGHLNIVPPRAVDHRDPLHPPHPGELAAGVLAVGALHCTRIAVQKLLEAERRSRRPGSSRRRSAPGLVSGLRGHHLIHTRIDPLAELTPRHRQPDEEGRVTQLGGPQPLGAPRRLDPRSVELGQAGDPLAVIRVDSRRVLGVELGMQRRRAPLGSSRSTSSRISGETGGRRSRSASAARRYRPVPPTTIGRRPSASRESISAWASSA